MPKNTSARQRRRTRRIADTQGVKYTAAVRLGKEQAIQDQVERHLRPPKIDIDGATRYWRRGDAEALRQDGLTDPMRADVAAAADVLLRQVRSLRSAKLKPTIVIIPSWHRPEVAQSEQYERFRDTVQKVLGEVERVREEADHYIDWHTVARTVYQVKSPLCELGRITDGWLSARVESAARAAETLSITAEAVHGRGCLLGATRSRLGWGYSPCDGGPTRVKLRIYDEETTVTAPGCPRHAAEEIVHWDIDVEDGDVGVEIMGGTDDDLDAIYDLADEVRREHRRIRREREANPKGSYLLPSPPWARRQD